MRHRALAFTLIELLVVVTIIVILLALLVPAMDKAIYQSELVACGAQLKAVATSVQTYAAQSQRSYPYRVGARDPDWSEANLLRNANPFSPGSNWDERDVLRQALSLKLLVCPLTESVDLDDTDLDTLLVFSTYALRFDFGFAGAARMAKLGQRWSWADERQTHRFSILAHDFTTTSQDLGQSWGTHPDALGVLSNNALQDENIGLTAPIKATGSRWEGPQDRGDLDLNFAYDDGSVSRIGGVGTGDGPGTGMVAVPEYDAGEAAEWPNWRSLVPAQ